MKPHFEIDSRNAGRLRYTLDLTEGGHVLELLPIRSGEGTRGLELSERDCRIGQLQPDQARAGRRPRLRWDKQRGSKERPEPIAGAQHCRREPLFMPQFGRRRLSSRLPQRG